MGNFVLLLIIYLKVNLGGRQPEVKQISAISQVLGKDRNRALVACKQGQRIAAFEKEMKSCH